MKKIYFIRIIFLITIFVFIISCNKEDKLLNELEKKSIKYEISEFYNVVGIYYTEFGNFEKAIVVQCSKFHSFRVNKSSADCSASRCRSRVPLTARSGPRPMTRH